MTVVTRRPSGPLGELVTAVTYRAGEQPRRSVEKILPGTQKFILDTNGNRGGVLPFLPLKDLVAAPAAAPEPQSPPAASARR